MPAVELLPDPALTWTPATLGIVVAPADVRGPIEVVEFFRSLGATHMPAVVLVIEQMPLHLMNRYGLTRMDLAHAHATLVASLLKAGHRAAPRPHESPQPYRFGRRR